MIDENARKLIERAAANLRARSQAAAPPVATGDWDMPEAVPPVAQLPVADQPSPVAVAPVAEPAPNLAAVAPVALHAEEDTGQAAPEQAYAEPERQYAQAGRRIARERRVVQMENRFGGGHPAPLEESVSPAEDIPAEPEPTLPGATRQVAIDRGALARHGISMPTDGRSRVAEEFRIVKRQIVTRLVDDVAVDPAAQRNRVIMVTSAKPGEGKTFTAVNLALSIASEQDLKVLLIDLDTKNHALQEMMGFNADLGLIDLLSDPTIDFQDVVLRTNLPNLSIMPAGQPNNRSPEILSSKRARAMLTEMTQRYSDRFIIFDAPSCLASSEPATLASVVGQILFVVEASHTQQEEIESAINVIGACSSINLLLNKVRASATDQFGSGSYPAE